MHTVNTIAITLSNALPNRINEFNSENSTNNNKFTFIRIVFHTRMKICVLGQTHFTGSLVMTVIRRNIYQMPPKPLFPSQLSGFAKTKKFEYNLKTNTGVLTTQHHILAV